MTQGFEVIELIVDVKNCLQVTTFVSPESCFSLLSNRLLLVLMMYL